MEPERILLDSCWGVFRVQVGWFGSKFEVWDSFLGFILGLVGQKGGLGGPEATGKGFGRAWVGPRAAGDPEMGPTWVQLEPSWSQLGSKTSPT